jgi:ABC-type enterochelin transport system permease subunit
MVSIVQTSCFVGVHIPCIVAESRSDYRLPLQKSMKTGVNIFASMKLVKKKCIYDYLLGIGLLISMDGAWAFEV